jgi:type IV pilus assembly protein PilQ
MDCSTVSGGRVDIKASHLGAGQIVSNQFQLGGRAHLGRSLSVEAVLKAFESNNAGEVVAKPQIKVRSGKTGYIQVGSDFSITTADFAGNAITQFYSTGTILTVTPTLIRQENIDFIDLIVEAERSALIDPDRNLINKTVARTATLLKDGERTAVGGLFGQEVTTTRSGIPYLKNLPSWLLGLRYLFGQDSKQISKTDLVIILKVEIVPSIRQRAAAAAAGTDTLGILQQRKQLFEQLLHQNG